MRIDPTTERWTRDVLGHAIRGELAELDRLINAIGDDRYVECTALSVAIAAYFLPVRSAHRIDRANLPIDYR